MTPPPIIVNGADLLVAAAFGVVVGLGLASPLAAVWKGTNRAVMHAAALAERALRLGLMLARIALLHARRARVVHDRDRAARAVRAPLPLVFVRDRASRVSVG